MRGSRCWKQWDEEELGWWLGQLCQRQVFARAVLEEQRNEDWRGRRGGVPVRVSILGAGRDEAPASGLGTASPFPEAGKVERGPGAQEVGEAGLTPAQGLRPPALTSAPRPAPPGTGATSHTHAAT